MGWAIMSLTDKKNIQANWDHSLGSGSAVCMKKTKHINEQSSRANQRWLYVYIVVRAV